MDSMDMRPKKSVLPNLVLLFVTILLVSGCISSQNPIQIDGVEIDDYQGEKLSSLNEFRENSIKGPQYIDNETYTLQVTGLVSDPGNYSYEQVINGFQNYEKVVTLNCVEGWSVTILWEGFLVRDIINTANPGPDANTVILHAYDGYSTSFPIEYLLDNDIIMAYRMNGVTIPTERGFPFQLVAESKWGYKWIKWITEIEISDYEDYRGYWESRGYSNQGDLGKPFIGR